MLKSLTVKSVFEFRRMKRFTNSIVDYVVSREVPRFLFKKKGVSRITTYKVKLETNLDG